MVTDEIFFDAHLENMMHDLRVYPKVVYGEAAIKAASKYGNLSNGAFLWEGGENTVALRNKNSIATAAHEMQHCWQYWHASDKFHFNEPRRYSKVRNFFRRIAYNAGYLFNRKEIDAEKYAVRYCNNSGLPYDLGTARNRYRQGRILRGAIMLSSFLAMVEITYVCAKVYI